jgi:hypothetical protein
MEEIRKAVIQKLSELEQATDNPLEFWLEHQRYLREDARPSLLLDFLGVVHAALYRPICFEDDSCEECYENTVFYDATNDDWICGECGSIQNMTRSPLKRKIPESSKYKHQTHLHQILYELQCLRKKLPPTIVNDVHLYLELEALPITYTSVQKALRPLGYKQHYSMIPTILSEIDPAYKPLQLSRYDEDRIQGRFFQYVSLGQMSGMEKNRLNYHYVIYQIAKLERMEFILPYLRLPQGLKSRKRHDNVWREICVLLKWNVSLCDFKD